MVYFAIVQFERDADDPSPLCGSDGTVRFQAGRYNSQVEAGGIVLDGGCLGFVVEAGVGQVRDIDSDGLAGTGGSLMGVEG